jgi:ABC-type transport system involved in multi-copper enzyme maturation permease subunit
MNWRRVKALMRKDIGEVLSSKLTLTPLIVVPLVLCVLLPVGLMLVGFLLDVALIQGAQFLEKVIPLYPVPDVLQNTTHRMLFIFFNYTFVPFFMIVPLMVSSLIAANSVVGEKERGTLETLLYTPISNRELIVGKLLGSFLPAVVVSSAAFVLYLFIGNAVSLSMIGFMIIRSPIWIPAMLLLSPATSLLGLSLTLLVSIKSKTYVEAQQISGVIVLPIIVLVVIQMTGVLVFSSIYVVAFSVLLLIVSYVIFGRVGPKFSRESILNTL